MRGLLFTLAGLLAVSSALVPMKRATTEFITDGSFEDVGAADLKKGDISAGDWQLNGFAFFTSNAIEASNYKTPYGKQNGIVSRNKMTLLPMRIRPKVHPVQRYPDRRVNGRWHDTESERVEDRQGHST